MYICGVYVRHLASGPLVLVSCHPKQLPKLPSQQPNVASLLHPPDDEEAGCHSRKDISNFITQLKRSHDPNKQHVLALYKGANMLFVVKAALLRKWKIDKPCKLATTYQQDLFSETTVTDTVLEG